MDHVHKDGYVLEMTSNLKQQIVQFLGGSKAVATNQLHQDLSGWWWYVNVTLLGLFTEKRAN